MRRASSIDYVMFVRLGGVCFGLDETPCVVLWRPEALDSRMLLPPEAWNWLPVTRPVWDSNPGPPASESRPFATELSAQLSVDYVLSSYRPMMTTSSERLRSLKGLFARRMQGSHCRHRHRRLTSHCLARSCTIPSRTRRLRRPSGGAEVDSFRAGSGQTGSSQKCDDSRENNKMCPNIT